jgi:hypothetical protein
VRAVFVEGAEEPIDRLDHHAAISHDGGRRVGGAVVAWSTRGVDMLERRDDLPGEVQLLWRKDL